MPREGVPYPERLLCSLRCELKNIWNALSGKLHSINGVEGDGQGNITIVSENAALTVNDYPLSNQIGLDLDPSQLPAADVNSVNGQTGVVVLNADDIPSDGGSDVQADIDALKGADVTLQGNINAEALARQNADSTLQTNINAANASISLKVDKLTTAGDYAYTHSGSTDGETAIVNGTTAGTLPIRDSNGRIQAADPASGATDKTLVNANWISQTGDSAPNNVTHRTGDEKIDGVKTMTVGQQIGVILSGNAQDYTWYKVATILPGTYARITIDLSLPYNNNRYVVMDVMVITPRAADPSYINAAIMSKVRNILSDTQYFGISFDGTNFNLYIKSGQYVHNTMYATTTANAGVLNNANSRITPVTPVIEDPTTFTNYVIV